MKKKKTVRRKTKRAARKKPARAFARLKIFRTSDSLFNEAAENILSAAREAVKRNGRFIVALAGGSTPRSLYSLISQSRFRREFPWLKTHFFWGDERWVPKTDPRSNYKMFADSFLAHSDLPEDNVHPVDTAAASPEESARSYEKELRSFFGVKAGEVPCFDLVLLGLGQDGHVASIFPGSPLLKEQKRLVRASQSASKDQRVTMTLRVFNKAKEVLFLVMGKEKSQILREVFKSKDGLPAQRIRPAGGRLRWFVDAQAASLLGH